GSGRGRGGGRAVALRRAGGARAGSGVGGGARGQVVRAWSGQRGVEEVAHEAGREGDGVFELAARGFQDGGVLGVGAVAHLQEHQRHGGQGRTRHVHAGLQAAADPGVGGGGEARRGSGV